MPEIGLFGSEGGATQSVVPPPVVDNAACRLRLTLTLPPAAARFRSKSALVSRS
jgi:hypothetical protein